ncbi:hypothetical protein L6164_032730 [Bauhinia variegata]|uniref:Uncharacterized protein n=1 Tax=Bauhinia variegata TaxID=167791 RepID=A0ACB9KPV6_BAUVA|nr:hypothetical protein L6164_032730 [Bauhinia variegata]
MKIILSKEFFNPLTVLLLFLVYPFCCNSLDTITPNRPLRDRDGDVLVSDKGSFALGFFSPVNSTNRYVGVWYQKVSLQTVVWVANRDTPLTDTSGVLSINSRGNLVILNNQTRSEKPIWSANGSVPVFSPNTSAKLLDTGNFVLVESGSQNMIWQSFDYLSNTMLPFMKLGLDRKTGLNRFLTSWRSSIDPGTGNLTYRIDPTGVPQMFLYKNGAPLWRVGSWTGQRWSGVPEMTNNFIFNVSYVDNANEVSIMYGVTDPRVFSRMVVEDTGHVRRSTWQAQEHRWFEFWYDPKEDCDNYKRCGANSNCNPYIEDQFECDCLPGFEPKFSREWFLRDASSGCVRNRNVSTCQSGEGFVQVARVKTPDTSKARVDTSLSLKACEEKCLKDCSCAAYTSADERTGSGCLTWHGDMVDTRTYTSAGQNLYIRVDARELAKYAKKQHGPLGVKGMIAVIVVSVFVILLLIVYIVHWFVRRKKQVRRKYGKYPSTIDFNDSPSIEDLQGRQNSDLPFFDLRDIVEATDNFSPDNKLGQGGFGSVYKGLLSNGMAIAVKRLSRIFGGEQIEANTNRVVGTYGYMSPEYAMEGIFSIKSDIYSFGVLILEIITGRKNSGHYEDITSSTLVGHIWDLWREGRALEIVDPSMGDTCLEHEVLRCIQIGLLCVQDYPTDRPTMSVVISMLGNDTTLPTPKQPVFIFKRYTHTSTDQSTSEGMNSVNGVSITMIEAR